MAFGDIVQHTNKDAGSVTSTTLAFSSNVTAGNSIVVVLRRGGNVVADSVTVTDNNSAVYTQDNHIETSDPHGSYFFRTSNATGGATTLTITFGGAAKTMRFAIAEYSGNFVLEGTPPSATGTSQSPSSGSQTTSKSCAIIGGFTAANNGTGGTTPYWVVGAGFTMREQLTVTGPAVYLEDMNGAQVAGTYTAACTFNASSEVWGAMLCCYSQAGAAAASPPLVIVSRAAMIRSSSW